jgi:hypothetical protein
LRQLIDAVKKYLACADGEGNLYRDAIDIRDHLESCIARAENLRRLKAYQHDQDYGACSGCEYKRAYRAMQTKCLCTWEGDVC